MKVLQYRGINSCVIDQKYHKLVEMLERDDFNSADVKKIFGTKHYRAKLDYKNRLLFAFTYKNKSFILILEVIYNHAYDRSRFLHDHKLSFFEELPYLEEQGQIFNLNLPLMIIDSAGSGKILFVIHSAYIDSIKIPSLKPINLNIFKQWVQKYYSYNIVKDPNKLYEKFNGVLTADCYNKHLSLSEYLNLGIKQSVFNEAKGLEYRQVILFNIISSDFNKLQQDLINKPNDKELRLLFEYALIYQQSQILAKLAEYKFVPAIKLDLRKSWSILEKKYFMGYGQNYNLLLQQIDLGIDDKLVKINKAMMEYLLVSIMIATFEPNSSINSYYFSKKIMFSILRAYKAIDNLPKSLVPEFRKKRAYIASVLAKNEVNSNNQSNRKLFCRLQRCCYILNPQLNIKIDEVWINIYQLLNFSKTKEIYKNIFKLEFSE